MTGGLALSSLTSATAETESSATSRELWNSWPSPPRHGDKTPYALRNPSCSPHAEIHADLTTKGRHHHRSENPAATVVSGIGRRSGSFAGQRSFVVVQGIAWWLRWAWSVTSGSLISHRSKSATADPHTSVDRAHHGVIRSMDLSLVLIFVPIA